MEVGAQNFVAYWWMSVLYDLGYFSISPNKISFRIPSVKHVVRWRYHDNTRRIVYHTATGMVILYNRL